MRFGFRQFRIRIPSWLIPTLGYAISIASLVWILQGVDFGSVIKDFQSLHWGWVVLGVVADIAVYVYQAWRWNLLLSPVVRPPLWRSVQAIYVGLFSNEVLPLRPGELIRSYLQAHWSEVPFSVSFSSAVIERLFDGIWLIVVFALIAAHMAGAGPGMPPVMIDVAKVLGGIVAVFALLFGLVMFWKQHAHRALPRTRWGMKMRVLIDDLHIMGHSKSFYVAAAASLPYLLMQVIPIYALIRGYDLALGLGPAMVVLIIWRIGTAVPQAPGNIGTSQALMVLSLSLFGIDKTTATGLSMVTWGVITLPLVLGGFIALALSGVNLKELRDHARAHARVPVVMEEAGSRLSKSA